MATYYPSSNKNSTCTLCNTAQSFADGTNGTNGPGASSGTSNVQPCSAYCNTSGNNTCDNSAQTFCGLGRQYISKHADVGSYPIDEIKKDDIIYKKWTASKWNSLIKKLDTAGGLGLVKTQGGAGNSIAEIKSNDVITAEIYNAVEKKMAHFNVSYNTAEAKKTIISATVANAMKDAYEKATFNTNVCDICNSTSVRETPGSCSCNCPTCSSCPSCSTCPSCSCNCSCNCTSCSCPSCSSCSTPASS